MNGPRPNSIGAPIVQENGIRCSSATQRVVDGVVHVLGDRQGDVRPVAGRRRAGQTAHAGVGQLRPDLTNRRLGLGVEEQLDGVHHQTAALHPVRSNAAALIAANSAPTKRSRPRRQHGAQRRHRRQHRAVAGLGDARILRPRADHQTGARTRCAASASSVSAVWFSVPRPAATTTSTGAPRSTARSRSVTPPAPISTSRPPAPSTRVSLPGRSSRGRPSSQLGTGRQAPSRPAARPRPGASGSG